MSNLIVKYCNQKCEKFYNGKILQDFENINKNIFGIMQIEN